MRVIAGVRGLSAGVGVAVWVVARGASALSDPSIQPFERRSSVPESSVLRSEEDLAAFDAYKGQLQQLLAAPPRTPAGSNAVPEVPVSRLVASYAPTGVASTTGAAAPSGPSSVALSGHSLRSVLVAEPASSTTSPRPQPVTVVTVNGSGQGSAATAGCSFFKPGAERTPATDCMGCHGSQTHPVDIDYAGAAARRPGFYRPPDEVLRRGVFLPDGQVKCVTCHDLRSPWKDKIALPPGAAATPAVDLARPETYERQRSATVSPPPPGSAVTPTPLCQSCHTYGD